MRNIFYFLLLLSLNSTAQPNLKKGLMAYYPFNGNANDESGNNNNAVKNNATPSTDRFGKANSAYHFNGIYQYIQVPNKASLNFNNQISISVWVRPTGFYYGICHASQLISKGGGNYNPGNYALRFDDALYTGSKGCDGNICDTLHQNFRGTGTVLAPYPGDFIQKNKWYNVLYTNDGDTARLYVDCELKYAVHFPETFTNDEDLFFGKSDDEFFPYWLNGDLDDIRIYNRALSNEEVFLLCNEMQPVKKDTIKQNQPVKPIKEIKLEKRSKDLVKEITVDNDSISVTLYDNGIIDGDSITLVYNDKILTTHQLLTDKPLTFFIKVNAGNSRNELMMYAENLGSIPPNTALMVIYDGKKRYELNVSSTKKSNGVVSFKLRE